MVVLKVFAALLVIVVANVNFIDEEVVVRGQFPFFVIVEVFTASGSKFWCSGALVRENFVITNAHCFYQLESTKHKVIAGGISHNDKDTQNIAIIETYIHPNYKFVTDEHDVAISQLERKVKVNEYVQLINLPQFNEILDANWDVTLVGYRRQSTGDPKVKFYEIQAMKNQICKLRLKKAYPNVALSHESKFCLPRDEYYKVQHGDIIIRNDGNKMTLIGLATGNKFFDTWISSHVDWINSTLAFNLGEVAVGQFSFIVIVKIHGTTSRHTCLGVLVGENHVVTRSDCDSEDREWYSVVAGAFSHDDKSVQEIAVNSANRLHFTEFQSTHDYDNILVLSLKQKVQLSENVQVIKLPEPNEIVHANGNITMIGFLDRSSEVPRLTSYKVQAMGNELCKLKVNETFAGRVVPHKRFFCIPIPEMSDNLHWEVFVQNHSGKPTLVGLQTHGNIVFHISYHLNFIKKTMKTRMFPAG